MLIDGVAQKLGSNVAKSDDASPWSAGNYGAEFSKLRGKYDAFLIEYPPNRSQIKFHLGTETGHSEGCIVTRNANIVEIEKVLADNDIPKNNLKFDVRGDFPISFTLMIKDDSQEVAADGHITLTLSLAGGGAPGGVSKDIWFHIVADTLTTKDFQLAKAEKVPPYVSRSSYPNSRPGVLVRLPEGSRSIDVDIVLTAPPRPVAARQAIFSIDNYKILNKAPGPAPYFYTPSDYKLVIGSTAKTGPVSIKAGGSPAKAAILMRPPGTPSTAVRPLSIPAQR